ncbi:MAG: FAD-dependent oxidoreductase [Candidatus Zixiibacteriota bacterium]
MINTNMPILVIGGGIAGITAAVDAAEVGCQVILVEKEAYLGGRVLRMYRYFPKMCPPTCGFEINSRRIRNNPRITVYTMASVEEISGVAGSFMAKIKIKPRFVTGDYEIPQSAIDKMSSERANPFNYGMDTTKALFKPHEMAYPPSMVLDKESLSVEDEKLLNTECPPGAIDFNMAEKEITVKVGAIIVATGWRPYDATNLDNLGYGKYQNIITNVMMERLASRNGPTGGEILRPSDGKKVGNVAFVQCAGSRDENHLPYCSAVCCMASLKQARYIREKNPDAKVTIFYIDIRTIGREEKFYYDLLEDDHVRFIKGKVAKINQADDDHSLILDVEDTLSREKLHSGFDMVVLATGMVPNTVDEKLPYSVGYDDYGFINAADGPDGIFAVGCAGRPCDVSRAAKGGTGAALKAIQCMMGGVRADG